MNRRSILILALLLAGAAPFFAQPVATPLYTVRESMQGMVFSIGGKDYGPYERTLGQPVFSPAYKSWILAVSGPDGSTVFLVNGKEIPFPKKTEFQDVVFIDDTGSHWAIRVALTQDQGEQRECVFADGKVLGPFMKVDIRSESGGWYAMVERKDKNAQGRYLLLGDRTYGPYDDYREHVVDPASGDTLFQAYRKDQAYLLGKGKELGPFQRAEFVLDQNGVMVGTATQDKTGWTVQISDRKYGPYEDLNIRGAWTSKDRSSWMLVARRKDGTVLLRDGKESVYDWADINVRQDGYLLFASKSQRGFISDGVKDYGPYWNIFERYVPRDGMWAACVEKRRADGSSYSVVVTPSGEFPGNRLRFDGVQYTWLSVSEDGVGNLMRMAAR